MWKGNSWYWATAHFPDLEKQKPTVFLEKMQLVGDRRESYKITGGPGRGRGINHSQTRNWDYQLELGSSWFGTGTGRLQAALPGPKNHQPHLWWEKKKQHIPHPPSSEY